jgi:type 1 glutamine amidotransferase
MLATVALLLLTGLSFARLAPSRFRVLIFSKTAGFRHDSIPTGITTIRVLGANFGFDVDATEDGGQFTDGNLARYAVVIFLNTTGDVLNDTQQGAFERFIRAGGGYVGVHSAADTEYGWPFYGELMGAYFNGHPPIQTAQIKVPSWNHPATAHLPPRWTRTDEWYNYQRNPGQVPGVLVLLQLMESTYSGGTMGLEHPIAWCREYKGGRGFYTGGGHTAESFVELPFVQHLLGGILWAAQRAKTPRRTR